MNNKELRDLAIKILNIDKETEEITIRKDFISSNLFHLFVEVIELISRPYEESNNKEELDKIKGSLVKVSLDSSVSHDIGEAILYLLKENKEARDTIKCLYFSERFN